MKTAAEHKINLAALDLDRSDTDKAWSLLSALDTAANTKIHVIDKIRNGIPADGIEAILEKTNINRNQLSRILHISTRQMSRYTGMDRLSPEQSNFLYELARIYTKAEDVLGDKMTAEHWLNRKNVALGEQSPIELLDTAEGVRLVSDLLAQIEYGFYS